MSRVLDFDRHLFVNTDLSVHLEREPVRAERDFVATEQRGEPRVRESLALDQAAILFPIVARDMGETCRADCPVASVQLLAGHLADTMLP